MDIVELETAEPKFETVHHYNIIAQMRTPGGHGTRPGRVVFIDKGREEHHHRYVIAWQGASNGRWDNEWNNGQYIAEFSHAFEAFVARCQRWIY
jgi:hypothetical protein